MLDAAAHELGQLFVDDLHNHLGRGEGFQHIRTHTAVGDRFYKILGDLVADIRFQQSHADFPHCLLHIALFQASLAPELFEGGIDFFS